MKWCSIYRTKNTDRHRKKDLLNNFFKSATLFSWEAETTEALPEGVILIGLYAGENELVTMKQLPCGNSTSFAVTIPFAGVATYAKVFVWSTSGGIKPLGGAERVAITTE